jgi:hypothetical protein
MGPNDRLGRRAGPRGIEPRLSVLEADTAPCGRTYGMRTQTKWVDRRSNPVGTIFSRELYRISYLPASAPERN